eukprot:1418039-Pyramimonas_sp.AAC.2
MMHRTEPSLLRGTHRPPISLLSTLLPVCYVVIYTSYPAPLSLADTAEPKRRSPPGVGAGGLVTSSPH